MTENKGRGTRVHMPDLDWSQVRETVLMLELAAGQIEAAMTDSNASVEVLTDTFTGIAESMAAVSQTVAALPESADTLAAKQALQQATDQASGMIHQAVVAFQFYDKLVQRLAHVTHSLAGLSALVTDQSKLYSPQEWRNLQGAIRAKYSMVEEQAMFEAVMQGMSVQQALAHFMSEMKQKQDSDDDIELF